MPLNPLQYRNNPGRVSKSQEYEHELNKSGILQNTRSAKNQAPRSCR